MELSTSQVATILKDLMETCKQGEDLFRKASSSTKDYALKRVFRLYSQQRKEFVEELSQPLIELKRDASQIATGVEGIETSESKNTSSWVKECEQKERTAYRLYQEAMRAELPPDLKSIVSTQASQIQEAYDYLRGLRATGCEEDHLSFSRKVLMLVLLLSCMGSGLSYAAALGECKIPGHVVFAGTPVEAGMYQVSVTENAEGPYIQLSRNGEVIARDLAIVIPAQAHSSWPVVEIAAIRGQQFLRIRVLSGDSWYYTYLEQR